MLKQFSRWKIGGLADFFAEPQTIAELKIILEGLKKHQMSFQIIGDGSNILFDDSGYRGLILKIGRNFNNYYTDDNRIVAEAGSWMPCIARYAANQGLSGIEHTIGIPGTFGGLIIMNGGSMQKSLGETIDKVFVLDDNGAELILSKDECNFSYRHSLFQEKKYIVYKAILSLSPADPGEIKSEMLKILENRRKKFPLKSLNCGSVFKSNPMLYQSFGPPGKIIEELGLKGYRKGGAMISTQHSNFLINIENASSTDIIEIVRSVREKIFKKTNVWIESEIRYLKPTGDFHFLHEIFNEIL